MQVISTTAVGMLVVRRAWSSGPSKTASEEKILAEPSPPKRMTRLSKMHRPVTSTGRAAPTKASAVTR